MKSQAIIHCLELFFDNNHEHPIAITFCTPDNTRFFTETFIKLFAQQHTVTFKLIAITAENYCNGLNEMFVDSEIIATPAFNDYIEYDVGKLLTGEWERHDDE